MPSQDTLVYEKAKRGLPAMNPTDALLTMTSLSPYKRQLFLVAEEDGLNRSALISRFPKVPDKLKERLHNGS